ncbi:MAG: hypothetical protein KBC11_01265 [Candidatus Pacebacteria bacterium]|nr:hypothetical protein [Candidatus Paceibacterota bacterium]
MDPNIDARLKSIEEKLEKNTEILTRIRRVQKNSQLFKIFYWTIILLATFGAFYYIQPYLNQLVETYTGVQNSQEQIKSSFADFGSINDIISQLKGQESQ